MPTSQPLQTHYFCTLDLKIKPHSNGVSVLTTMLSYVSNSVTQNCREISTNLFSYQQISQHQPLFTQYHCIEGTDGHGIEHHFQAEAGSQLPSWLGGVQEKDQ